MRTEDGSIIYECLNGKPEAFGILVDKYKAGIYAFVCAEVRNFHDAEDVTQEVFIQAYRDLRSLRRWESFAFWLYRIASSRSGKWIRTRSRRPDSEFTEDQDSKVVEEPSLDAYRSGRTDESLWEALDLLSETYREVLLLHYFGGMTIKDIARAIGASPGAIGMRLSRARAQLKEEMAAMMSATYEQHSLPASFTFRIVEMVKRIRIHPMPKSAGLPWGLSLAVGIMIAAMTLGSKMVIHELPKPLVFPGEITPEVREMSVDILGAPGTSITAGNQGDTDGGGIDPRNLQNSFLLAPAKGGGTWTQKADMPTARYLPGSAVVDGKIYVIGGAPASGGATTAVVEEYDPATDTWRRCADMPTARAGLVAAAVDGIIYAIGAAAVGPKESTVEAYDPATDTWTTKADMPTGRGHVAIAVVDGIIYVIGGQNGRAPVIRSTVEAYDPATDKWTKKADMPTARFGAGACVIDGRIYVSGGNRIWGRVWASSTVEVYDPAIDEWIQAFDMPRNRSYHTANVVAGKMYIIGGGVWPVAYMSPVVDVYDPATDTWTTAADFTTPRWYLTSNVVDGKIYSIGGQVGEEHEFPILSPVSTVEEFDPGLSDNISVTSPAGKLLTTWGEVKSE